MNISPLQKTSIVLITIILSLNFTGCGGGGGGGGGGNNLSPETTLSVTIVSPSGSVNINQGQSVDFQGNATGGTEPYQFLWTFGGATADSNLEKPGPTTFDTLGSYTVTFKVTDANGMTNTATVTVTVRAPGTTTATTASIISPVSNTTITAGQSVDFQGSVAGGEAPFSYLWTFGGTVPNSTIQNPGSVTFNTPGTYMVTFKVTDMDGDVGSDSRTITVNAQAQSSPPTAKITIVSPSGSVNITQGQSIDFQGNVTGGKEPYLFLWTFGGASPNSTLESPGPITFNTVGTYTVIFKVTDANGISSIVSDSITVNVRTSGTNTTPTASITSPVSNTTITAGQSVNFQGSVAGGNAPFTYLWTFGGTIPNSTAQNPGSVTFNTPGTYIVTFKVTDKDGDVGSNSRTITVNAQSQSSPPTAKISSPTGNVTINAGQTVNFQGTANGGTPPLTYLWHFGGTIADSTAQNPGATLFSAAGTYTVSFTVTDAGGRKGSDSIAVNVTSTASLTFAIVLAANDLGMHCMDREFSVFSILPPFNVVHAQVLMQDSTGNPILLSDAQVNVRYDATPDAAGSINSISIGKTNFWQYANSLFGMALQSGQGLLGYYMPGDDPLHRGAQPMEYGISWQWFTAHGIPLTPLDDASHTNTFPLMRIIAYDKTGGSAIGHLDVVVPVASETDCQTCHKTGGIGSTRTGITWANDSDLEVQAKKNILLLHDAVQGTTLTAGMPVLCASCHYSPALDLAGSGPSGAQVGKQNFSNVMHAYHGNLTQGGTAVFPPNGSALMTCYQCHPGKITQCARGAMKNAGLECKDCHGNMLSVGASYPLMAGGSIDGTNDGKPRRPWQDLPRCQACHTGDAVSYVTGSNLVVDATWPFHLRQAYRTGDNSASPLLASNNRFAENTNTLYRFSIGHGGITCEGCHGSTHAEWPNATSSANDNVAATQLQGHSGKIMECVTCHKAGSLPRTTAGPHGLHNVNDALWYNDGHEGSYQSNPNNCKACHGLNLLGTSLAKVPVTRTFTVEGGTVTITQGSLVSCNKCHGLP